MEYKYGDWVKCPGEGKVLWSTARSRWLGKALLACECWLTGGGSPQSGLTKPQSSQLLKLKTQKKWPQLNVH